MAWLVSWENQGHLFRSQLAGHLGPPDLGLKNPHQDVPHFVHHQPVPRLPGFGADTGDAILYRKRLGGLDKSVNPLCVGVEHQPGITRGGPVVLFGAVHQPEPAHQNVLVDCPLSHDLRPPAAASAPVVFHLPQPVLGREKTLGKNASARFDALAWGNPHRSRWISTLSFKPANLTVPVTRGRDPCNACWSIKATMATLQNQFHRRERRERGVLLLGSILHKNLCVLCVLCGGNGPRPRLTAV